MAKQLHRVLNLRTGEWAGYFSGSPREAVVSAWWYHNEGNRAPRVEVGKWHVFCGDFGVRDPDVPVETLGGAV